MWTIDAPWNARGLAPSRRAERKVDVLAVEEVYRVEAFQRVEERPLDQHEAAGNGRNLAYRSAVVIRQILPIRPAGPLQHRRQAAGEAGEAPHGGQSQAGVAVVDAVDCQCPTGVDTVTRPASGEVHQSPDHIVDRARVGVEQHQIGALALVGGSVDRSAPTDVLLKPHEPDGRKLGGDPIGGPVARSVVDDDHVEHGRTRLIRQQIAHAPQGVVAGVVGDDDHRRVRGCGHF